MGEAVRQMFTAIAQHYDVLNTVLSFGLHHYWRQQAVAVSGIPSGVRLLDVCSGTADLALAFPVVAARRLRRTARRLVGATQPFALKAPVACTTQRAHRRNHIPKAISHIRII